MSKQQPCIFEMRSKKSESFVKLDSGHICILGAECRVRSSQVLVGGTVSGWGAPVARQGGAGVGGRRMGVGAKPASSRQLQRGAPAPAGQQRHAASWKEQATQPHNLNHLTALVRKMYRKALWKGLERTLSVTAML